MVSQWEPCLELSKIAMSRGLLYMHYRQTNVFHATATPQLRPRDSGDLPTSGRICITSMVGSMVLGGRTCITASMVLGAKRQAYASTHLNSIVLVNLLKLNTPMQDLQGVQWV